MGNANKMLQSERGTWRHAKIPSPSKNVLCGKLCVSNIDVVVITKNLTA